MVATLVIAGFCACIFMDSFQRLLWITFKIAPSNWAMVGRWSYYLVRSGRLINPEIEQLPPAPSEHLMGWVVHYLVGIGYAAVYLALIQAELLLPGMMDGAVFGIASVIVPWFFFLPAMGKGMLARLTDNPRLVCLLAVLNHLVFGLVMAFGYQLALQNL